MKKFASLLALVLVCAFVLAGCGSKAETTPYDYDLDEYISLGKLADIKLDEEALAKELTAAIDEIRNEYTVSEEVKDRAVQKDDTVYIDYKGKIDGEEFSGGSAENSPLTIGSGKFIPGFEDKLIGWNVGDEKDIELVFPEDYKTDPSLSGKDVVFTVKINKITAMVSPAISDKMIEEKTDFATVKEFCDAKSKEFAENLVWADYVDSCLVTKYPEKETKVYYDNLVNYYKQMAASNGMTLEALLTSFMGYKNVDEFFAYALDYAKGVIKEELVVYHTARTNNITLTDEQYQEEGAKLAEEYGYKDLAEFETNSGKESIQLMIYTDKIIAVILGEGEVAYEMPETSLYVETEEPAEDAVAPAETNGEETKADETKPEETKVEETKAEESKADATTGAAPDETTAVPEETTAETVAETAATETETTAQA